MKRNIKTLIAAAAVLAIIAGLYVFAVKWQPQEESLPPETDSTSLDETEYLAEVEFEDVSYIEFNTTDEKYIIRNGDPPVLEGYFSNVIDTSQVITALRTCSKIIIAHKIENPKELSVYGLDKADRYIVIRKNDGSEEKIVLGNSANFKGEFYAMNVTTGKIGTVAQYVETALTKVPSSYRTLELFELAPENIKKFTIEKNGKKEISVEYDEEYAAADETGDTTYIITYPYAKVKASLDKLKTLFDSLSSPTATAIAEENPRDLSAYGLDKPYVLTFTDDNGTITIKMGDYSDGTNVYMMYNDLPVVYEAQCPFYEEIKSTRAEEYAEKYVNLFPLSSVSAVKVTGADGEYNMQTERENGKSTLYRINGKKVSEDAFLKAYQLIIDLSAAEFPNITPRGEEKCRITFTFNNNEKKTFIYYVYDERNCIVKTDGGIAALVLTKNIDAVFESLK